MINFMVIYKNGSGELFKANTMLLGIDAFTFTVNGNAIKCIKNKVIELIKADGHVVIDNRVPSGDYFVARKVAMICENCESRAVAAHDFPCVCCSTGSNK